MKLSVLLCLLSVAYGAVVQERQLPPPPPPSTTKLPPPSTTKLPPPPTTQLPPTTTKLPPTTTKLPPTTTKLPPTTTKLPPTTTKLPQPTTTKLPPPTTTKLPPPTTTNMPPPTTTKLPPPTTTKLPPTTTNLPPVTTNLPATTTKSSGSVTTTTASPSVYNQYQLYLIEKAKALAASGTCNAVASGCTNNCTTKATSLYYSWTDASYRYIISTGIPNHTFGSGAVQPNPNSACENINYFKLPLNPVKGTTSSSSPMGPIGAAVTGAYFYNTLSAPDGSLAVPNEGKSLDSCMGHSDPSCRYHYHSEPTCVANYNGGCVLLGYWYDGFPIYSYCPSPANSARMMTSCYSLNSGATGTKNTDYSYSKTSNCDLDQNNGYTHANGTYAYYMTSTYPWLPVGYSGSVAGKVCRVV